MVPEIGKKYGPYEILGHLGGGGMGFVYRAWDGRLHREVAIKLLHSEYTMTGMRERFLREARAASALNHPNICTIFDIGEQNGEPYLVMELLEGQTLKDLIDYRTVQVDEILCIGREVAEALGAAHAKGVIHRDIKPANIFLVNKPNGSVQAKVLDFGLAKFQGGVQGARNNRSLELTAAGATVGTLAYMSPEQARGEVLDSRSDLFSLGVVLYEMATRHIPFPGATSALVFVQLLNHQPESVRNWNESVPKELDRIIFKLMAKERTQRFQTGQELEEALNKVGEKSVGWLRKNASTVPLVRAPDPVARDKRNGRKPSHSHLDAVRTTPISPAPTQERNQPTYLQPALQPPAQMDAHAASDEPQILRPVARVPRAEPSPVPALAEPAAAGIYSAAQTHAQEQSRAAQSQVAVASAPEIPAVQSATGLDTGEFAAALDEPYSTRPDREGSRVKRSRFSPAGRTMAGVLLLLIVGGTALYLLRDHLRAAPVSPQDSIVLTEIENRTGDRMLDGALAEALQIELVQSPYLQLRSLDAYRVARRSLAPAPENSSDQVIAHNAAKRLGTKAYLFGAVTGTTSPYLIHVDLLDTASNDVITSAEERVPSLQQIPVAVDHIAGALRSKMGERGDSISRSSNPLDREATTDLEAMHAFSQGDAAFAAGRNLDALRFYQAAAGMQPRFVQAQIQLAVMYRRERSEVAAADAAKLALAAADNASERTRTIAQYEYEMNVSGDFPRAASIIRQLINANPHDAGSLVRLARTLRLEGRFGEAQQAAQQAINENAFSLDAYTESESALIGLDKFEAASLLDAQAQRAGVGRLAGTLTSAYLGNRQQELDAAIATISSKKAGFRPSWNYGVYLDNIGQLAAGAALWRDRADGSLEVKGLESTAGYLLAQGAVDRAMFGDCAGALAMAREADGQQEGITAVFNIGMANALCANTPQALQAVDRLQQTWPQSFNVKGFYIADIRAAIALQDQDPTTALDLLKPARQWDLISLTPLLRGRAHVALRQVQIGIVDFQTVLTHRGVPFIVGSVSYPVAQIGVARAFADTGDQNNSAEAYRRFLELWKNADANQPLLAEARAHTH